MSEPLPISGSQHYSRPYLNTIIIGGLGVVLIGIGIYKLVEASKLNEKTQAKEKKNAQFVGGLLIGVGSIPVILCGYQIYQRVMEEKALQILSMPSDPARDQALRDLGVI